MGDLLFVDLEYTTPINVSGNPRLVLNTVCYDKSCVTKEVQTFTCAADRGKFGMRLLDEFVMNVDAKTTMEQFKLYLEVNQSLLKNKKILNIIPYLFFTLSKMFTPIIEVTVKYSVEDDREYSHGERICSSKGNLVTIIFENVSLPSLLGDVPEIIFDPLNGATGGFVDLRSGFKIGDGDSLAGVNPGFEVSIPKTSNEVLKGRYQPDGYANYLSGSGTNGNLFEFINNLYYSKKRLYFLFNFYFISLIFLSFFLSFFLSSSSSTTTSFFFLLQ